ncbi:MAG: hypothetical protein EKK34_25440 [Mycobacterium sp.]|nr:MAG: hypothetical protein EKK34_25440 [Mycobacterium sp.]
MVDRINTQSYFDGATALFDVAQALQRAQATLAEDLAGTEGMAGKDERGKEFGEAYDEQASRIEMFGRDLAAAVQNYGRVLRQAGINHAGAEADSNINGGAPMPPPADPGELLASCVNIPRASGGSSDGLMENIGLLEEIGIPVPDGDTEKLKKAENAWARLGSGQSMNFADKVNAISSKFDELNGDEVDIIVEDLEELGSLVQDYTSLANSLRDACANHFEYLTELRNELDDILQSLAIDLAVTAAIGILSSFVSFGAGAAVAGGKAAATIARYAMKIRDVIQAVKRLKAFKKISEFFAGSRASSQNEKLIRFLQMQLKSARTQGMKNNLKGRIGELKAGIDPNVPKTEIVINGRTRIPDRIDPISRELTEVKNVNSVGKTKQIEDMLAYAGQRGYTMTLVVDTRTAISGPLQQLVNSGQLRIIRMALN